MFRVEQIYSPTGQARGLLWGNIFYRYTCPFVWKKFLPLEVVTTNELETKGCEKIIFIIRPELIEKLKEEGRVKILASIKRGRMVELSLKEFQNSMIKNIGLKGDKRPQYLYNLEDYGKQKRKRKKIKSEDRLEEVLGELKKLC